jgi:hypothetical protein
MKFLGQALSINNSVCELDLVSCYDADIFPCFRRHFSVVSIPFHALIPWLLQLWNPVSEASICFLVSCILHNENLTEVAFLCDPQDPAACIASDSWAREGLAVPPAEVAREGWSAVLEFLRKERKVDAQFQQQPFEIGSHPHPLCAASHPVPRAERRRRLHRFRLPQLARAFSAAARPARFGDAFAARARARVAAAVVPQQHAARAAAVLLLPAVRDGLSPAACPQQTRRQPQLRAQGHGSHHEALLCRLCVAPLDGGRHRLGIDE